jgi:hypothetical protein
VFLFVEYAIDYAELMVDIRKEYQKLASRQGYQIKLKEEILTRRIADNGGYI